jgi:hypothetical protein
MTLLLLLILNFHFTHISRFSNVSCMGEEIVKSIASNQAYGSGKTKSSNAAPLTIDQFDRHFREKQIDIFFLRVSNLRLS